MLRNNWSSLNGSLTWFPHSSVDVTRQDGSMKRPNHFGGSIFIVQGNVLAPVAELDGDSYILLP